MATQWSIWLGYDPREVEAYAVARDSLRRYLTFPIPIHGVILSDLEDAGFYTRPTKRKINSDGRPQLVDCLSRRDDYDGAMSTEFAISRFLVPHLAGSGMALFMDCDILARGNVAELFRSADPTKAVSVVKHDYTPKDAVKMDGQVQSAYSRKNWSSVMLFNCDHSANKNLTLELINSAPGRDLHRFCWLEDGQIGELDPQWNYLVGESPSDITPKIVHFTLGHPGMPGYERCEYADEWRAELRRWAA